MAPLKTLKREFNETIIAEPLCKSLPHAVKEKKTQTMGWRIILLKKSLLF